MVVRARDTECVRIRISDVLTAVQLVRKLPFALELKRVGVDYTDPFLVVGIILIRIVVVHDNKLVRADVVRDTVRVIERVIVRLRDDLPRRQLRLDEHIRKI